jgi:exonuclease SbcC
LYINKIRAGAFGPLRGEDIELGPGLNVVHGPNEAGKSSWFAATYAGLAGRRKFRGRGTAAESDFKTQHKPWSGTRWAVGVTVTLDSGLTLGIDQDLARGEAKIVDVATGQTVSQEGLEQRLAISLHAEGDASLDGTRLLGLNRESARATVFTGQADILRVLDDAAELQQFLERAAATEAVDATADGAVSWLEERKTQWVGVGHTGNRPLRATRQALTAAQGLASSRRDDLGALLEAIGNRNRVSDLLQKTRERIELADRLTRWQSVYDLRGRVEKARELSTRLAAVENDLDVDDSKLQTALEKLGAFDSGTDAGPTPSGSSVEELQAELEALPQLPTEDIEPRPEFIAAQRKLAEAGTALTTHMETAPRPAESAVKSTLSADQLRTFADVLESSPPQVDEAVVVNFERTQGARSAELADLRRAADDATDAYERAKADYDAAVLREARPDELAELHNSERQRAEQVIDATRQVAAFLGETILAQEQQAETMAQEVALRRYREGVDAARKQVLAASMEPDPAALRQRAKEMDGAKAAQERAQQHEERSAVLRSLRDDHTRALAGLLGHDAPQEISEEVVDQTNQAFKDYLSACAERAAVAQQARRRPDLEAALAQRRELESARQRAAADRERQGRAVIEFATSLGLPADSAAAGAESLRWWVKDQEAKREASVQRREDAAALTQVLDGRTLDELQSQLIALTGKAGPEPEADAMPADLSAFRADAVAEKDRAINTDGQLRGQIQTLSRELESVAEAVEGEADAARAVEQVETLKACLDDAITELERARDEAHASIAPALQDRIRPWLPRVTNGRYLDVAVKPDDLTMQVTESGGQKRAANRLSHGTTEQIYLLLRVALSEVLSGGAETAPLILDDVTTQSDSARTVGVMELLHELSTEHQVILFTQEDAVVDWAKENCDPERDRLIALAAPGS